MTDTRDTDDLAILTHHERGWTLLSGWHGKLPAVTLRPEVIGIPVTRDAGDRANRPSGAGIGASGGSPNGGGRATKRFGAGTSSDQTRVIPAKRRSILTDAPRPPPPGSKAPARAVIENLPTESGNSILVYARAFDALAGVGDDRDARVRIWALTGTDFLRNGVAGFGRKLFASGLADDLLVGEWTAEIVHDKVNRLLARLSSPDPDDVAWRGSGRAGRMAKTSVSTISLEVASRVFEAYQIGMGEEVDYTPVADMGPIAHLAEIDDEAAPPRMSRHDERPVRHGLDAQQPLFPYRGRPDAAGSGTPAESPKVDEHPRKANILHAEPRHAGPDRPDASRLQVRARAPGPSVVNTLRSIRPEFEVPRLEEFMKQEAGRNRRAQQKADKKAKKERIKDEEEEERAKKEELGMIDDKAEITDPAEKTASLNSIYDVASSHELPLDSTMRFLAATSAPVAPSSAPAPSTSTAPPSAPAPSTSSRRSGARRRSAQAHRLTTAIPTAHRPSAKAAEFPSPPPPKGAATSSPPPTAIPNGITSLYPVARLFIIAGHEAIHFGHVVIGHLLRQWLHHGEGGLHLLTKALVERNSLARLGGSAAAKARGRVPGSRTISSEMQVSRGLHRRANFSC